MTRGFFNSLMIKEEGSDETKDGLNADRDAAAEGQRWMPLNRTNAANRELY